MLLPDPTKGEQQIKPHETKASTVVDTYPDILKHFHSVLHKTVCGTLSCRETTRPVSVQALHTQVSTLEATECGSRSPDWSKLPTAPGNYHGLLQMTCYLFKPILSSANENRFKKRQRREKEDTQSIRLAGVCKNPTRWCVKKFLKLDSDAEMILRPMTTHEAHV